MIPYAQIPATTPGSTRTSPSPVIPRTSRLAPVSSGVSPRNLSTLSTLLTPTVDSTGGYPSSATSLAPPTIAVLTTATAYLGGAAMTLRPTPVRAEAPLSTTVPRTAAEHELRHLRDALHRAASWAEIARMRDMERTLRAMRDRVAARLAAPLP